MTTWGKGRLVTDAEIPASACVSVDSIIDLTDKLREDGTLDNWTPGPGKWKVQRIGYMSQMSSTGGGLQADKFSADAARIVFQSWFGEFQKRIAEGKQLVKVKIDKPYYMGVYEVTQSQWKKVMGTNPSVFQGDKVKDDG